MKNLVKFILALLPFLLFSCLEPNIGISPIGVVPEIPQKILLGTSGSNAHPVGVVLHVDVERFNPLNAKYYFIRDRLNPGPNDQPNLIQFFDTVVLSYAYMERTPLGTGRLRLTPALQYILENNETYIRPLRARGIRVLVEVRSGNYAPNERGSGFGLGTMDDPAIGVTLQEFKLFIDRFQLDGFEFNDVGGGYLAYPPYTRRLTQFESNEPMYPDRLFQDENGNFFSNEVIEEILWLEGGHNFSSFVHLVFEELKDIMRMDADFGVLDENDRQEVHTEPTIIVRQNGHGSHLFVRTRYDPDAYTGASFTITDNLAYIVQDFAGLPGDIPENFVIQFDNGEDQSMPRPPRIEARNADSSFAPFILDLSDLLPTWATTAFRNFFLGNNDPNLTNPVTTPRRLGALYFKNLPPVSDTPSQTTLTSYLTRFSVPVFGTVVTLAEGGGDRQVNWGR